MSIESLSNTTATIYTITQGKDGYGSYTDVSDVLYIDAPCRIQPMSGNERAMYRRNSVEVDTKIFFPGNYSGIVESGFIIGANGTRYDIEFVQDVDLMQHHYEVYVRSVRTAL